MTKSLPRNLEQKPVNVVILGVSYFEGMASSTRVRNLLEPLIEGNLIKAANLVYEKDANGLPDKSGILNDVKYKVIGFRKSNPLSIFSFTWDGIKFLKKNKIKNQTNILYNYDQPDLRNIVLILYAKAIGFKIILDIIEDNRFYTDVPRLLTKIKIKSSIFLIKRSFLFADTVFAISAHLVNEMTKNAKGKVPVYFIPITVDLRKFPLKKYQIPENFKIFYGGSFGSKDGLEYLIRAFEEVSLKFQQVSLILTGRGADHDMKPLNFLINNSEVKNKIIFKGFLAKEDYYKLINECDIFCMTRLNTKFASGGFPFKLGEFLATQKAVVATNIGDIPTYLNNTNSLLINPSSVDELTSAILSLLNNPSNINIIGTQGRKIAETHFDSEKVSRQILSVFQNLDSSPPQAIKLGKIKEYKN